MREEGAIHPTSSSPSTYKRGCTPVPTQSFVILDKLIVLKWQLVTDNVTKCHYFYYGISCVDIFDIVPH